MAIARSDAEAAGLDAAEARLIISASIAQTYIGLARAQQLIRVTNEFVKTREEALALTRSKARYALASEFDQRTAETLLAQARQAELRAAAPARISTSRLRTMTTPFFAPCANRPTH
ncbi:MAG TPA: TolC family protein [Paraburkholderia sp.]|uniref:TolC family protein n=1 Tax=Paraburkholderia sp. TaxID=1926495 RepID=UPI002C0C6952|nr:TolC family protein [Paraburkholderia sp.]HTR09276.1 TolC family protein [Paraburkholderia sp.]